MNYVCFLQSTKSSKIGFNSFAVIERDLNVSEMQTLRQPPRNPLANNAVERRGAGGAPREAGGC